MIIICKLTAYHVLTSYIRKSRLLTIRPSCICTIICVHTIEFYIHPEISHFLCDVNSKKDFLGKVK